MHKILAIALLTVGLASLPMATASFAAGPRGNPNRRQLL